MSTVPQFLYGTAWKEEATESLVTAALEEGFRGIDTANQRKHYHEAGVGEAVRKAMASGAVTREELFLQTKYTYLEGQDRRLPFDPKADYPDQVRQSFDSSLQHLGTDYLDSFLIHGPRSRRGLSDVDLEVWRTMEELHRAGRVRAIGISNATAEQIGVLCERAEVAPSFVQNRCFARFRWDGEARKVCAQNGIRYQGFSLLTANIHEIQSPTVQRIARAHGRTLAQVVFRFAIQAGMLPLTGTSDRQHMREDLAVLGFELSAEELAAIEGLGTAR